VIGEIVREIPRANWSRTTKHAPKLNIIREFISDIDGSSRTSRVFNDDPNHDPLESEARGTTSHLRAGCSRVSRYVRIIGIISSRRFSRPRFPADRYQRTSARVQRQHVSEETFRSLRNSRAMLAISRRLPKYLRR